MVIRLGTRESASRHSDAFKRQTEFWRQAYAQAVCVRELFPDVEEILIESNYVDPLKLGTYSPRTQNFYPAAKAFFAIACPRTLCLHGGFRLESIIEKLLRTSHRSTGGTLECAGRMEPVDAQPVPCALRMHYRIEVRYQTSRQA